MSTPERDLAAYDAEVSAEQERDAEVELNADLLYMGIPLWLRRIIPEELQEHCHTEALRMLNERVAEAELARATDESFYQNYLEGAHRRVL